MKVAWNDRYGPADVVTVQDRPRPRIGKGQILVRVAASSVTTADWRLRAAAFPGIMRIPGRLMFGLRRPRKHVLGNDFAGRVEAVGERVTRFTPGDAVFGFAFLGAHAEYLAISETAAVTRMPDNLDPADAAAVPFGALSALVFLRDFARVRQGQKVLVLGASGGVGVFAVQLARQLGAEVTGVSSAANLGLVRALGADRVVDYALQDIAAGGAKYDAILDTVGALGFAEARRILRPWGRFVPLEFGLREIWQALITRLRGGPQVVIGISGDSQADLEILAGLLKRGELCPVIGGRFPLDRIAEAHRMVEGRHKRGSVVIDMPAA